MVEMKMMIKKGGGVIFDDEKYRSIAYMCTDTHCNGISCCNVK